MLEHVEPAHHSRPAVVTHEELAWRYGLADRQHLFWFKKSYYFLFNGALK